METRVINVLLDRIDGLKAEVQELKSQCAPGIDTLVFDIDDCLYPFACGFTSAGVFTRTASSTTMIKIGSNSSSRSRSAKH